MLGVRNDCLREASLLRASERGKRTREKHVPFLIEREVVTSRCHGSKIYGPQQTEVLQSGGGGAGGSQSSASGTLFSRLPYVFVPLSPDSRPLLCFSCYHVNHAVWLPILTGSALALSKMKTGVVNRTTSHSPARSVKRHSFDITLHHAAKSSVFWVVRGELPGRSSMEGFFPTTPKNQRPIKMVFDDILSDSLCCSYGEFRQLARQ